MATRARGWRADPVGDAQQLTSADVELEAPASDELLVAVEASVLGAVDVWSASGQIIGGACVGRVVEAGDAATALLDARVVVGPVMPCGECDVCRRGAAAACPYRTILGGDRPGTLASHVVANARWVCELSEGIELPSPAAALLGREAVGAYGLFVRAGAGPGEPVVIVGENVIARMLVEIAVAKGVRPLVVSRADATWNEWLRERGAVPVDAAPTEDVHHLREQIARAAAEEGHGIRPWRVFATSAATLHRATAMELAGPGATVALLGPPSVRAQSPVTLDFSAALTRDVTVICVAAGHPDLIPEVAALAARGDLDLDGAARVVSPNEIPSEARRVCEEITSASIPVVTLS